MDRIRVEVDGGPRALSVVIQAVDAAEATTEGAPVIEDRRSRGVRELLWVVVAIGDERRIEAAIARARERWPGKLSVKLQNVGATDDGTPHPSPSL